MHGFSIVGSGLLGLQPRGFSCHLGLVVYFISGLMGSTTRSEGPSLGSIGFQVDLFHKT